jgi:uncharacterized membrane protein (DUF4010 family)
MIVICLFLAGVSAILFFRMRQADAELPTYTNPSQLKPALVFGGLYALVLLLIALVDDYYGNEAIYGAAVISGLTDVDALTLSVAELVNQQRVVDDIAWRAIFIGMLSNLAFKAGIVGVLGGRRLFAVVGPIFAATIGLGILIVLFWP